MPWIIEGDAGDDSIGDDIDGGEEENSILPDMDAAGIAEGEGGGGGGGGEVDVPTPVSTGRTKKRRLLVIRSI